MEASPGSTSSEVQSIIRRIDEGKDIPRQQADEFLNQLEAHECWVPCFRLLKRSTEKGGSDSYDNFVRLARIQAQALEDFAACGQTIAAMIKSLAMPYLTLRDQVIPIVLSEQDWDHEASVLEGVQELFQEKSDRILCLERLCLLYEKKIHHEKKLQAGYERILKLDPKNIKALRYFKLAYTQAAEWDSVVSILKRLMGAVVHKQELHRYAQELAAIYLYQLDRPKDALSVLDQHCSESPLDSSMISFDAYQRMGDMDGCIRVLRGCLLTVENNMERAILHIKIGELEEQTGRYDESLKEYRKASSLSPDLLEPMELAANLCIQRKDWSTLAQCLDELKSKVIEPALVERVGEAIRRLEDAMSRNRT